MHDIGQNTKERDECVNYDNSVNLTSKKYIIVLMINVYIMFIKLVFT